MRVRVLTIFLSLVLFIGCSSEMNFHTLYIGHLFYDVPEEYAMPYKLSKCKLLIDTYYEPGNLGHGVCNRCGCECDDIDSYVGWCVDCIDCTDTAYLKKMGVSKRSDEMIGTLLPPDCVTGVINVVDEQGIKLLEMSVRRGEMTSLKLWDSGYLLYEAEGAFTSEIPLYDVPIYSFLSGNQKIYNNGQCVIERQSNFIEGCQEFTPYEIPYDSWLEETLKSHIEQEKDIDSKRRIYPEGNTTYKACPVCGGSGKISQTGMGIILGYTTCPNCGGVGKIVDPKDFFGF